MDNKNSIKTILGFCMFNQGINNWTHKTCKLRKSHRSMKWAIMEKKKATTVMTGESNYELVIPFINSEHTVMYDKICKYYTVQPCKMLHSNYIMHIREINLSCDNVITGRH